MPKPNPTGPPHGNPPPVPADDLAYWQQQGKKNRGLRKVLRALQLVCEAHGEDPSAWLEKADKR